MRRFRTFRDRDQAGFLNLFYSIGAKRLSVWDQHVDNGYIKRITDQDIRSCVVEIVSMNVNCTFITCPKNAKDQLAIKFPFRVSMLKYLKKYFTFENQVLDDMNTRRRFRPSNYQSKMRVKPFVCMLPMCLDPAWDPTQFKLSDFTGRAYGINYIETIRVSIFANCWIRRIYSSNCWYIEDEVPPEYRLIPRRRENDEQTCYISVGISSGHSDSALTISRFPRAVPDSSNVFIFADNSHVKISQ
jgi:hypothetical protein